MHHAVSTMTTFPHRLAAAARALAPLSVGIIIAALCLYQGRLEKKYKHKKYVEAFPFSHYPMFSGFDDFEFLVFLADGEGQALPIETLTHGFKSNALKKKFDDKIDDLKDDRGKSVRNRDATPTQMQPAGEATLRWLCESYPEVAARAPVRLYQVRLTIKDRAVQESEPILVAEYPSSAR
jgi:hypothetical protein